MRMVVVLILFAASCLATVSAQANGGTAWSGTLGQRRVVVDERFTPPFTNILVTVRVTTPGQTSTIDSYLTSLAKHFGEEAAPQ